MFQCDITIFSTFCISKFDIGLQSHKMLECEIFGGHHIHIKMFHNCELKLYTIVYHFQPITKMLAYFTMLIHSQHDQPWLIQHNPIVIEHYSETYTLRNIKIQHNPN